MKLILALTVALISFSAHAGRLIMYNPDNSLVYDAVIEQMRVGSPKAPSVQFVEYNEPELHVTTGASNAYVPASKAQALLGMSLGDLFLSLESGANLSVTFSTFDPPWDIESMRVFTDKKQ